MFVCNRTGKDEREERRQAIATRIDGFTTEMDSEKAVSRRWIENMLLLPSRRSMSADLNREQRKFLLHDLKEKLDTNVTGHSEAKTKIISYMNKALKQKAIKGSTLGLLGPPGVGKSTLTGDHLSSATGRPIIRFNMDGAQNVSLYFGLAQGIVSCGPGAIFREIVAKGCSDPIFVFEEIDKISTFGEGPAVAARLKRFVDGIRNDILYDDFIGEVGMNLSSSLVIFTYNNKERLEASFRDRLVEVVVGSLSLFEKEIILRRHIFPNVLQQSLLTDSDLSFTKAGVERILQMTKDDPGARGIEKLIESYVSQASALLDMDVIQGRLTITTDTAGHLRLDVLPQ